MTALAIVTLNTYTRQQEEGGYREKGLGLQHHVTGGSHKVRITGWAKLQTVAPFQSHAPCFHPSVTDCSCLLSNPFFRDICSFRPNNINPSILPVYSRKNRALYVQTWKNEKIWFDISFQKSKVIFQKTTKTLVFCFVPTHYPAVTYLLSELPTTELLSKGPINSFSASIPSPSFILGSITGTLSPVVICVYACAHDGRDPARWL